MSQYFQNPVGFGEIIYFLAQQSLFRHNTSTGHSSRMCSFRSEISSLKISPDGSRLSFFAKEDSNGDIYVYDTMDNSLKRISFFNDPLMINLSIDANKAIFASCYKAAFRSHSLYSVDLKTLKYELIYKSCSNIAISDDKVVLQQFGYGYHSWKEYQGGQAARLYFSEKGSEFRKLNLPKNNCYSPLFVNEKLYFLTDITGNANIHEYDLNKNEIIQKTFLEEFYIRDMSRWRDDILFSSGGDIYCYYTNSGKYQKFEINLSDYSSLSRPFVFQELSSFSTSMAVSNSGKRISFAARGNVFLSQTWTNSYLQLTDRVRYRISAFLENDKLLMILDANDKSIFEIYDCKKMEKEKSIEVEVPIVNHIESISKEFVLISNDKGILAKVDLNSGKLEIILKARLNKLYGFSLSQDKKWISYSTISDEGTDDFYSIWLYEIATDTHHKINAGGYSSYSPTFSRDGKYLYFLSERDISTKYGEMYFDINFEINKNICAICLNSEVKNPFKPQLELIKEIEEKVEKVEEKPDEKVDESKETESEKSEKKKTEEKEVVVQIKLDELNLVISEIPAGKYLSLEAVSDSKLLLLERAEKDPEAKKSCCPDFNLKSYDLPTNEISLVMPEITGGSVSFSDNREWMMIKSKDRFRVGRATETFMDSDKSYKNAGWLDTSSVVVKIDPRQEWENILEEHCFLVSYNFWKEIKLDLTKYKKLLPKVNSKEDLNKILEEINGELRCSHAYILYRANEEDVYHQNDAYLAAEFKWNEKGYQIESFYDIPDFPSGRVSPLLEQGSNIKKNDTIIAIDGIKCSKDKPMEYHLSHKHNKNILISFLNEKQELDHCMVKPIYSEKKIEYTKWVLDNRKYTHKVTGGRIGYIHIPDMGPWGFREFAQAYLKERTKDGLIIDVRYNGGGNVHPLIINILSNIETGSEIFRDQKMGYPWNCNKGKLLLLCNEKCGSDGDLMVYSFKKRRLGKVVGMRTWGGIVGIIPDHVMIDNTLTSQPEFATWMHDIGLGIENEGVHPDVEVQNSIEDIMNSYDRQLETGINMLLADLG